MKECDKIRNLLEEIYRLFSEQPACYELYIQARLAVLWAGLYEMSVRERLISEEKPVIDRLKTMLLYINEHFAEKITLEQIADAGNCSRRECSRSFQKELRTTPFRYLAEVRVTKATQMLVNTDNSITYISEACGFSDPGHFAKIFRDKSGMTPKEFRKRLHD